MVGGIRRIGRLSTLFYVGAAILAGLGIYAVAFRSNPTAKPSTVAPPAASSGPGSSQTSPASSDVPGDSGDASPPSDKPLQTVPAALAPIWGSGWSLRPGGSFGTQNLQVLESPGGGWNGPYLHVTYPAGSASQTVTRDTGAPVGGAQLYLEPEALVPASSLYLRYLVRFSPGFQFVKGGKLPGLFGGTVNNGQHIPNGTNGFSTRYMWRSGGDGEVYAYLPTSVTHGTELGKGDWVFSTGVWHSLEQHVVLNHPDQKDGSITVWYDGSQVYTASGLTFRTVSNLQIQGLFFSTFYGGDDPSWAPSRANSADFADFEVAGSYISR